MRVLVTGASGFVGREIVRELINLEYETIQIFGKTKPVGFDAAGSGKNLFSVDIADGLSFSEAEKIEPVQAFIHCAGLAHQFKATNRDRFDAVNVSGTRNAALLAVKLKARQFILISSTAVYGVRKKTESLRGDLSAIEITEDAECRPETVYAESKLAAEREAREICERNGIALTILRLAPVLGEGGAGNTARLIEAINARRFFRLGSGENLKTLVYKKDVAAACCRILQNKKRGTEIFNLAGKPVKMVDFVETIAMSLKRRIPNFKIPASPLETLFRINERTLGIKKIKSLGGTIEKWLSDDVYSAAKIAREYGFEPQTSTVEALERQVAAYLEKLKR